MVHFSWKKIIEETHGDVGDILTIMQHLAFKDIPRGYYDPLRRFYGTDFSGLSFVINPGYLLTEVEIGNECPIEACEYFALASLRDIQDLLLYRRVYLSEDLLPFDSDLILHNSLLRIKDGKILFKYEFNPADIN